MNFVSTNAQTGS